MTHWLDAPEAALPVSALPDPLERIGRHVCAVVLLGVVLSHGDWTRTHAGTCPSGCRPLVARNAPPLAGVRRRPRRLQPTSGRLVRDEVIHAQPIALAFDAPSGLRPVLHVIAGDPYTESVA